MSPWLLGAALGACLGGCAHAPGPGDVASAYARALEEGRLAEAAALTTTPLEEQRYADAAVRRTRVDAVRAALPVLEARASALTVAQTPEGWRIVEVPVRESPEAVLTRFLDGVEAGDWRTAWSLLHAPLRERYTPERLHEDYTHEPLAAERLQRARLVSRRPARPTETGAEFPLGGERAVRLEREAGEYRVAALE